MAVLRCTLCGTERTGNLKQAQQDLLRCWTCRPNWRESPRVRKPKAPAVPFAEPQQSPLVPAPKVRRFREGKQKASPPPADAPKVAYIEGRIQTKRNAYSRAMRFQIDEDEGGTQHGRIEIAGFRTRNPLNQRQMWQAAKATAAAVKKGTMEALELAMPRPDEADFHSYEVKLVRITPRSKPDDDGVTAALKAVRDAFAIFVRINDGNRRRLQFSYGYGNGRVSGIVLEWIRRDHPFPDEGHDGYVFFNRGELDILASEHTVAARHWKEVAAKRVVSQRMDRIAHEANDEQGEEAAYEASEEDEGW